MGSEHSCSAVRPALTLARSFQPCSVSTIAWVMDATLDCCASICVAWSVMASWEGGTLQVITASRCQQRAPTHPDTHTSQYSTKLALASSQFLLEQRHFVLMVSSLEAQHEQSQRAGAAFHLQPAREAHARTHAVAPSPRATHPLLSTMPP